MWKLIPAGTRTGATVGDSKGGSSLKRPQQSWSRLLSPRRGARGQQIPTSCGSMLECPKKALARWVGSGQ